jgi:hypothetical protein
VTLDADLHTILALSGASGPSVIRLRLQGLGALAVAELVQIPHDSIVPPDGQSAIFKTDANRIDVILAFQLFELQARVRRIALEETKCALGVPLRAKG